MVMWFEPQMNGWVVAKLMFGFKEEDALMRGSGGKKDEVNFWPTALHAPYWASKKIPIVRSPLR